MLAVMRDRLRDLRSELAAAASSLYGDDLVALAVFGSWARGVATPESDLDVLVVARNLPPSRRKRVTQFAGIEQATATCRDAIWPGAPPLDLSPVIKTPEEVQAGSPLFLDMTDWCVLLVDRDGFLAGYLCDLRRRLDRLGARRRASKGGYYWEYKPGVMPDEEVHL
jgi:predicted nucleotidyltransferase